VIVPRPPLHALLVALLLGLLCSFAVACGQEEEGMLSPARAENLKEDLDAIDEAVAAGRCDAVDGRLDSLRAEIEDLPQSTDDRLRERLDTGVANLETQAPEECAGSETTETQPETVPEETVPTETAPPETTPPETIPPETTPPETTPPETVPPETTPPEEEEPPIPEEPVNPGGEEAPGAVVP
jgi:outer membrane biosynthesis protein TonB